MTEKEYMDAFLNQVGDIAQRMYDEKIKSDEDFKHMIRSQKDENLVGYGVEIGVMAAMEASYKKAKDMNQDVKDDFIDEFKDINGIQELKKA